MRAPLILICSIVGVAFGSFANVLIHRVPRKESIVKPRSRCPNCGHELGIAENIPLLSWLILRGRCKACRAPISIRYPAVQALTCALFGLLAWRAPYRTDLIAFLPLAFILVVLSFIDAEHKL